MSLTEGGNGSHMEEEWMKSCHALLLVIARNSGEEQANSDSPSQDEVRDSFRQACLVAAGAASSFLADIGTIVQLLVPGIMNRYGSSIPEMPPTEDSKDDRTLSFRTLSILQSFFGIEPIERMVKSTLVEEVITNWYSEARKFLSKADSRIPETANNLLPPLAFRSWDWPLQSIRDYRIVALGQPSPVPPKRSFPLLGGFNHDLKAKESSRPCVDVLTSSYMDLYAKIGTLKPDAERTAVCLICGEALDASGKGECTRHSYICGAGTGVCFLLQECVGLILHRGEGSFIHSIYVDNHGETPRGRPLYLDSRRFGHLRDLWAGHSVRQQVLAERESTQQGVITGYY